MEEWRKHHKRWKPPANTPRETPNLRSGTQNLTPSSSLQSKSSVGHLDGQNYSVFSSKISSNTLHSVSLSPLKHSTARSLSDAQLLAASPRETRLEEVACVILYRSRGDVNMPDIGRKCPHVSSLSLTKCGAMRMVVEEEGEEVGGVWEELVELSLQVHLC